MVIAYVIDWRSIRQRIEALQDLTELRSHLCYLRLSIRSNGMLGVCRRSQEQVEIEHLIGELRNLGDGEESPDIFNLINELVLFQKVYEDNSYFLGDEPEDDLNKCHTYIRAINSHLKRIVGSDDANIRKLAPQAIFVTDDFDSLPEPLGCFKAIPINKFLGSKLDQERIRLTQGQRVGPASRSQFNRCINGFAASVQGAVCVYDPYLSLVFKESKDSQDRKHRQRYYASIEVLLEPFVRNREVCEITFVSRIPWGVGEKNGTLQTDEISNVIYRATKNRSNPLKVKFVFVEYACNAHDAAFHDRFIISNSYTLGIGRGIDVCEADGTLREGINMILWGPTIGETVLSRANIVGYRISIISPVNVDCGKCNFPVYADVSGLRVQNESVKFEF